MRMSQKEYETLLAQGVHREIVHDAPQLPDVGKEQKRHKYGARKTEADGILFDSAAEANRYRTLKLLESAGEIVGLKLQPEFVLQEAFTHEGKRYQAIKYKADFMYTTKDGRVVVEDTKGVQTPSFRLKWKLLLHMEELRRATLRDVAPIRFVIVET